MNRVVKRILKHKKIQELKKQCELKVGRELTDEEFAEGFYLALNQYEERSKKKKCMIIQ